MKFREIGCRVLDQQLANEWIGIVRRRRLVKMNEAHAVGHVRFERRALPIQHEVCYRDSVRISHGMGQMWRCKGKTAGGKALAAHRLLGRTIAQQHFRFAFQDDPQFLVCMGVDRVRGVAGTQHRDVAADELKDRSRGAQQWYGPPLLVGVFRQRQVQPMNGCRQRAATVRTCRRGHETVGGTVAPATDHDDRRARLAKVERPTRPAEIRNEYRRVGAGELQQQRDAAAC